MSEWREVRVSAIASTERNALVGGPFGSNLVARDYVNDGVPVIRGQNMGQRWLGGEFAYVSHEKADSLSANLARAMDIVFTQRGTLGQVSIVPEGGAERYVISQSQMKLTVNSGIACPLFYYYLFTSPSQQEYVMSHAIQTGVPHTNLGILRNTPVPLPPLHEQRAIAEVLGALDDKIELNRRMNETLEAVARTVFKDWFVDFGPTRAKMEGRAPYLAPEIWNLFPDRLDGEGKPEGWQSARLGELCSRIAIGPFGSDITTDNFVADGVPVIRGGNLKSGFIDDNFVFVSENKADDLANANVVRGDIVLTHRGTLGQVGIVPGNSRFSRYVISQSQMFLRADVKQTSPRFIYEFLRSPEGERQLLANTSQTGVPAISRPTTSLKMLELTLPSLCTIKNFEEVAAPLSAKAEANVAEIRSLIAIRDLLLPKLMCGELRFRDAEVMVAAAA